MCVPYFALVLYISIQDPDTTMFVFLLCVALVASYILWRQHHTRSREYVEIGNKIPGPRAHPLVGNALQFGSSSKAFFNYMLWLTKNHGPIARVWVGPVLGVLIADPTYAEVIMGSMKFRDKATMYKLAEPWLGQGLLTNTGAIWRRHRKIITSSFHFKILEQFVKVFNSNVDILMERLSKVANGPSFDIFPYMTLCNLDIICEAAMGVKVNAQLDSDSDYVKALQRMEHALFLRAFLPWLQPDLIFSITPPGRDQARCLPIIHDMTERIIKAHRRRQPSSSDTTQEQDKETGIKQKSAFLEVLMQAVEDGDKLTDEELRNEVNTIMFAGHDTTTSAVSFACWTLAKHQDVQAKAVEELRSIFGNSDRQPTYRDLQEMKYLEQVIKETLRLYPSVPIYGRCLPEDVTVGGYLLPAGCNVGFNVYSLHRHPHYFPDPEKFDPDRFLPENCVGRHPYCYIPFSAGPRNCVGMRFAMNELKLTLARILMKYKILPGNPFKDPEVTMHLVIKSEDGVMVRLQDRKSLHDTSVVNSS